MSDMDCFRISISNTYNIFNKMSIDGVDLGLFHASKFCFLKFYYTLVVLLLWKLLLIYSSYAQRLWLDFFACYSAPLLSSLLVPPTIQLVNHGYGMQCKVCMQTFMCTTSEVKCREHAEAKHPKSDLYTCFPHLKKWQLTCETRTLRFVLLARKCICYPSCYYLISFSMHLRSIYAKEFYDSG